jgi:pimeloyl-ACP methyl ester carboxylesterase
MQRGYVTVPWGQLHYFEAGAGEVVFLYPNRPRSTVIYRRLAQILASRYRVIAMDPPGFGGSDPLQDPFELEDLTSAAVTLLDELGVDKFRASGHHTGALICVELAASLPDRVVAIAPCGTPLWTEEEREGRLARTIRPPAAGNPPKEDGAHLLSYIKRFPPKPPEDLQFLNDWMIDALVSEPHQWPSAMAVHRYREDRRMPFVKAPTLIVRSSGPGEPANLQRAEDIQKLIPGSEVAVIEGGDVHFIHHRADELAKLLLDFFARVDNRR